MLEIVLNKYVELLDSTDSSGNNVLHYAAQSNNASMVSILLIKNSTLAYKRNHREQYSPLHMAVEFGSTEAAKELLKQCPDVTEMVDFRGRNAFHIAVVHDRSNMLELLLKYVLPEEIVNQQDMSGNTPLHYGALHRYPETTLLLLNDPRVNPCLVNVDGHTAFTLIGTTGLLNMSGDEVNNTTPLIRPYKMVLHLF